MKVSFSRPRGFSGLPEKYAQEMKKAVSEEMTMAADLVLDGIEETPVYTGKTLVNYRFSLGSPIEDVRSAVSKPDLPGKTSEMSVGSEPRRSANIALVLEEYALVKTSLKRNPYQILFVTNNTPYFLEVEYGTYRTSEGHKQRTPPGGMMRRAEQAISSRTGGS